MSEEQGGFRPGRSTIDQFSLHEVLLRRRNGGESTFLYFVDFKKAFDTVWHDGLWHALHMSGIKGRPLKVLQSLYSDIRQSVLVDGQQTEYIRAHQGVRQGCPMSPVLFSIFIEQMVRRLKQASVGIKLDTQLMFALLYADDAVLVAESAEDLQNLINIVDEYCRDWRMLLNLDKSKAMVVPKQVKNKTAAEVIKNEIKQAVTVRGVKVPFVNEYKYLGVWIQQDLGWKLHIAHNVSKAKAKHAVIGPILRCGPIPAALKRLVWCAVVRSRLEYGAEVVTLNVELTKSLEGVQHMGVTTILRINRARLETGCKGRHRPPLNLGALSPKAVGLPGKAARDGPPAMAPPSIRPRPYLQGQAQRPSHAPVAHRVPQAGQGRTLGGASRQAHLGCRGPTLGQGV